VTGWAGAAAANRAVADSSLYRAHMSTYVVTPAYPDALI
jgi:hypothetical protein